MNDDLNKTLAAAMGDIPEQEQPPLAAAPAAKPQRKSTSKKTLAGPMVAPKVDQTGEPVTTVSKPVEMSYEELKLRAKLDALTELLAEERAAKRVVTIDNAKAKVELPPDEMTMFRVNLPVQAQNIRLDGREYYHGHTYEVPKRQAVSMRDIQFNAWKHDEQVKGERRVDPGFSTSDMVINANGQAISHRVY